MKRRGSGAGLTRNFFSRVNILQSRQPPPVVASVWNEEISTSGSISRTKNKGGWGEGEERIRMMCIIPILHPKRFLGKREISRRIEGRQTRMIVLVRKSRMAVKTDVDLLICISMDESFLAITARLSFELSEETKHQKSKLTLGCFLPVPGTSSLTSSPLGVSLHSNRQWYLGMKNRDR